MPVSSRLLDVGLLADSPRSIREEDRLSLLRALDTIGILVRTASDALLQSIEVAVAAEELGLDGAYFRVHHFRSLRLAGGREGWREDPAPGPCLLRPSLSRARPGADEERGGRAFLGDLRGADGIIIGSPELHGSLSGALKNALDLANRETFEGKMLGLIGVAGGRMGAGETLSHMRAIGRSLRAWVVPAQVSIGAAGTAFDSRGEPVDSDLRDRLMYVGRQVAHFAWLHKCENHLQFVKEWEGTPTSDSVG